ncbi:hypothetical protein PVK06_043436 [Gossypium arboreum]|uniref:Uncharacterized protein n=1 Tax=Gossypium arboreum TaxID=29729 RepID=A0ABR0MQ78_GOSAR|nr:hypothetical protein PVK06_043436 [Gossypium arboreum]
MLKRVRSTVKETWIIGGDSDAILNGLEKENGRRKPRALLDEFREVVEELSLEKDAKEIIKKVLNDNTIDILEKIELVGHTLGPWQYEQFYKMRNQMVILKLKINNIINGPGSRYDGNRLKVMRLKLGHLLDKEEKYWA